MLTKVNTMIKLPETVTGKVYVVLDPMGDVFISGSTFSDIDAYTCLGEHQITVDVPQVDPTLKIIESLESRVEDIQAEAAAAVRKIMDKIQQLKCLEHKGES
jgi:hypothetical protein